MAAAPLREHLPLTEATFHILVSLAGGPRHGWGMRHEIDERTAGEVQLGAGTVYTALQRLEEAGLIEEVPCPPELVEEAGPRWRFFQATPLGRDVLAAEAERMDTAVRHAGDVLRGPA